MKKLAAALALTAFSSSAALAGPIALGNMGGEPACPSTDFYSKYYDRTAPEFAKEGWRKKNDAYYHPFEHALMSPTGILLKELDAKLDADRNNPATDLGKKYAVYSVEIKTGKPAAKTEAFLKALRPRLIEAVKAKLAATASPLPTTQIERFNARMIACRMSHIGKRAELDAVITDAEKKTKETTTTALVYWTAFARKELAQYAQEAGAALDGKPLADPKKLWEAAAARAADAIKNAGDAAGQTAMINGSGLNYTVPAGAAPTKEVPVVAQPTQTAPVTELTSAERLGLTDKLNADYLQDRDQVLAANKGKPADQVAAAMKPVLERYREIAKMRETMPADHRKQYDAKIAASTSRQDRDRITSEYAKTFSPKKQLDLAMVDPNQAFDGKKKDAALVVAGSTRTADGRSKAEQEEDLARAQREVTEAGKGKKIDGNVPSLLASGIAPDKAGEEKKEEDPNKNRDIINGAKLGLWGALVGALTMGPLGMLFLGMLCLGLGTLMSKEANK